MHDREKARGLPSRGTGTVRTILIAVATALVAVSGAWLLAGGSGEHTARGRPLTETSERETSSPQLVVDSSAPATDTVVRSEKIPIVRTAIEPEPTRLVVEVLDTDTGQPVRGMRVFAVRDEQNWFNAGYHAGLDESISTDDAGIARIEVEPRTPLRVIVTGEGPDNYRKDAQIECLEVGETREVTILLRSEPYHRFDLRVLAEENGRPLEGVRLITRRNSKEIENADRRERLPYPASGRVLVTTDANGELDLPVDERYSPPFDLVAEGREPARVGTAWSIYPDRPLVVRLARAARLQGRVTPPRGGFVPDRVRLQTDTYRLQRPLGGFRWLGPEPTWEGEVSEDGTFEVNELPTQIPLRAVLVDKNTTVSASSDPLVLEPGEVRRVDWSVGRGATVVCRVVNPARGKEPGWEVWLVPASEGYNHDGQGYMHSDWKPAATRRTNDNGEVCFPRVPSGDWIIGLAPRRDGWPAALDDATLAAKAVFFSVAEDQHEVRVVVPTHRWGFIEGRVIGDADSPPKSRTIYTESLDGNGCNPWVNMEEDGTFRTGPLLHGRYRLEAAALAFGDRGEMGDSWVVEAATGDREVLLREPPMGSVSGVAIDRATGEEVYATVFVFRRGCPYQIMYRLPIWSVGPGFGLGGLREGVYDLRAEGGDGVGVLLGVRVEKDRPVTNAEVFLDPGQFVQLRYRGPAKNAAYRIERNGVIYASGWIDNGTRDAQNLPIGPYEVILTGYDHETSTNSPTVLFEESRTVEVGADAEPIVDLHIDR
jgi:hypothetical protein